MPTSMVSFSSFFFGAHFGDFARLSNRCDCGGRALRRSLIQWLLARMAHSSARHVVPHRMGFYTPVWEYGSAVGTTQAQSDT